jgi:hypothetical protein
MKPNKPIFWFIIFMMFCSNAQTQKNGFWGGLEPGPFQPGFRLIEKQDPSRFYPRESGQSRDVRIVRIYVWFPAAKSVATPLLFEDFLRMAAEDFRLPSEGNPAEWPEDSVPVPLKKGLEEGQFRALLDRPTASVLNADPADGSFPLIVLGQGLYYESPLSHLVMCEYLASKGYVVATCPLLGTQYRLANLNAEDLETQIRDMEFIIGSISEFPNVSPDLLGLIGYDMGGMAGVTLTMRNPAVDAFLCLDAAILYGHGSGLPNSHPSYREDRFTVPFMNITQAWFIKFLRDEQKMSSLIDRKAFGDSYLVQVPTHNHGAFSSYSMFGIKEAVPGYWGPMENDLDLSYQTVCLYALHFFDGYLKQDQKAISNLQKAAQRQDSAASSFIVDFKKGRTAPKSEVHLVHLLIEQGPEEALPEIEKERADFPDLKLLDQDVLNWLGYHFLYWWGREEDAVEVFKLNVSLYPQSANAYDSLGEAYMVRGEVEQAIASYEKSLELDPKNKNAAEKLKQLRQTK